MVVSSSTARNTCRDRSPVHIAVAKRVASNRKDTADVGQIGASRIESDHDIFPEDYIDLEERTSRSAMKRATYVTASRSEGDASPASTIERHDHVNLIRRTTIVPSTPPVAESQLSISEVDHVDFLGDDSTSHVDRGRPYNNASFAQHRRYSQDLDPAATEKIRKQSLLDTRSKDSNTAFRNIAMETLYNWP
ncbi:hypothetical protein EK21DRAFT_87724 [Setomelanomma holmii]|uniref:Uncharacterized protein n=1 Tax=Setomelanomma holmii TaxID=210430 RepID=A0A9P4HE46_9PLEO|nr:hypothetical protein EK21DRAFT_87724 [Setomelanomma holmii]